MNPGDNLWFPLEVQMERGEAEGRPAAVSLPVLWLCCSEVPARSHVPTDAPSPGIRGGSSP